MYIKYPQYVNSVIIDAIPINKEVKRYFVKKYELLIENNGVGYAAHLFKTIRELALSAIASGDIESFIMKAPVSNKTMVRRLGKYLKTQPHAALELLKIYTGANSPLDDLDAFAQDFANLVNNIEPLDDVKKLDFIDVVYTGLATAAVRRTGRKNLASRHGIKFGPQYTLPSGRRMFAPMANTPPLVRPEDYSDFDTTTKRSHRFERDVTQAIQFAASYSSQELGTIFEYLETQGYNDINVRLRTSCVVGEVVFIPKNGTTTYRPIGYANKLINAALTPYQQSLFKILETLFKTDHTKDQGKSDALIQERLNKGEFVASVDLSKATEYMPAEPALHGITRFLNSGQFIRIGSEDLVKEFRRAHTDYTRFVRDGVWHSIGGRISWRRGQALGTIPSFGLLALTHNAILAYLCEKLALTGPLDQYFSVLGDDLIVYDQELRDEYVKFMTSIDSPLSLHKSFDGLMTEFAGKVFVKNHRPLYSTDHNRVTKNTLFDFSKATGIPILYRHLPHSLRKWWDEGFDSSSQSAKYFDTISKYFANGEMDQRQLNSLPDIVLALSESSKEDPDQAVGTGAHEYRGQLILPDAQQNVGRTTNTWYLDKYSAGNGKAIHDALINVLSRDR